jgi:hypothetical protein
LNSIHNAVLTFKNDITQVAVFIADTLIEPLPVPFQDPAGHFGRNGSNFLDYRLLKTFQSLGTMLVYLGFEIASEEKIARGGRQCHHAKRQHAQETFL